METKPRHSRFDAVHRALCTACSAGYADWVEDTREEYAQQSYEDRYGEPEYDDE